MEIEIPTGKPLLSRLLNSKLRIRLTDGRILIGSFLCVDRDANIIIGNAFEYSSEGEEISEGRALGLAMVPGRHATLIQAEKQAVFSDNSIN